MNPDRPYCEEDLQFGVGAGWMRDDAGLHYLWWCAQLADEVVNADDPAAALQDRLEASREFWNEIQATRVLLDERSVPRHLAAWSAAVPRVTSLKSQPQLLARSGENWSGRRSGCLLVLGTGTTPSAALTASSPVPLGPEVVVSRRESVGVGSVKRDVTLLREAAMRTSLHERTPPIPKLCFDCDKPSEDSSATSLRKALPGTSEAYPRRSSAQKAASRIRRADRRRHRLHARCCHVEDS